MNRRYFLVSPGAGPGMIPAEKNRAGALFRHAWPRMESTYHT
jgi:hypothetical protein